MVTIVSHVQTDQNIFRPKNFVSDILIIDCWVYSLIVSLIFWVNKKVMKHLLIIFCKVATVFYFEFIYDISTYEV